MQFDAKQTLIHMGNAYAVVDGVLFTAPVFINGTIDHDNWSEYEAPDSSIAEWERMFAMTTACKAINWYVTRTLEHLNGTA